MTWGIRRAGEGPSEEVTVERRPGWAEETKSCEFLGFLSPPPLTCDLQAMNIPPGLKQKDAGWGPCSPSCLSSPLTIAMPFRPEKSLLHLD